MKMMSKSLVAAAVLAATSTTAMAELTANAGLVSNYVFRGFSYSDEGPALQGGLDYAHESGIYAGTWLSTIDNGADSGIEYDLYLGFANEVNGFGYDVGYIVYGNNDHNKFGDDVRELYLKGSYSILSIGYYDGEVDNAPNSDYSYLEFGADIEGVLPEEIAINLHYGILDPDAAGASNVNDFSVGVSKNFSGFDVNLTYTSEDATDKDYVWVGVSKEFAL